MQYRDCNSPAEKNKVLAIVKLKLGFEISPKNKIPTEKRINAITFEVIDRIQNRLGVISERALE
jgi:hypothetical protein